jgi:hypothetical protein
MAMAAMGKPETRTGQLCAELGITSQTLYRHVDPTGALGLMVRRCWAAKQKTASIREEAMSDRNGGKPPLDEILDGWRRSASPCAIARAASARSARRGC